MPGAIGTYYGAREQGKAAKEAAKTAAAASDRAVASTERMNKARLAAFDPFRKLGLQGMNQLSGMLSGPIEESPLYKWRIEQGKKQINQSLASRGQYNSGAGLQLLSDFYNRTGAQETDKRYNRLAQLSGMGANAGIAGYQMQQDPANIIMQGGINQANLQMRAGDIKGGMYRDLGKYYDDTSAKALALLLA